MERLDTLADLLTLSEQVGDATTVLVTGPTNDDRMTVASLSLLSSPDPTENHVRWVTMLRSPNEVARMWTDRVGDAPRSLSLVEVGERRQLFGEDTRSETVSYSTEHVQSPSDLTTLGVRLTEGIESTAVDGQHRLWFESLSTLLQYVPLPVAFKFVHTLHSRLSGTDSMVCYHLNPALHETRTVHTLLSVCDARVTIDDDITVDRRE